MVNKTNIENYKRIALDYVNALVEIGIPVTDAYIFGSRAVGIEKEYSDLDTCVISPMFGVDTIADRVVLTKIKRGVNEMIEPHPMSTTDFNNKYNTLANEVKKYGIKVY